MIALPKGRKVRLDQLGKVSDGVAEPRALLLFGSFLQPIMILFSLPPSIGGAIVALAFTAQPISLPVVIGVLMLAYSC